MTKFEGNIMTAINTELFVCPKTGWIVQPAEVEQPFEVKGKWFAWVMCPVCDCDENARTDPAYNPAHPGPHLLSLTPSTPPREWRSRWTGKKVPA